MKITVIPSNICTLPIRIRSRENGKYKTGMITMPLSIIEGNKLSDGDSIVLVYYCKEGEDPEKN